MRRLSRVKLINEKKSLFITFNRRDLRSVSGRTLLYCVRLIRRILSYLNPRVRSLEDCVSHAI
jgi:hypothetical protein